jgi:hypothetical protein
VSQGAATSQNRILAAYARQLLMTPGGTLRLPRPVEDDESVGAAELVVAREPDDQGPRTRRRRWLAGSAALAFIVGAALAFAINLGPEPEAQPPTVQGMDDSASVAAAPTAAASAVEAVPVVSGVAADPTTLLEPSFSEREPSLPAKSSGSVAAAKPRKSAGCAVPYTVDKQGVKRFKVECF